MFQVAYKKSGEILALKAVKKGVMSKEQATRTMTERSIMARVREKPSVHGNGLRTIPLSLMNFS